MKHNLKNRPKNLRFYDEINNMPEKIRAINRKYEAWFEGFEEELREKYLSREEAYMQLPEGSPAIPRIRAQLLILREILGEKPQ